MTEVAANFVGAIPEYYDHNLGSSMSLQAVIIAAS